MLYLLSTATVSLHNKYPLNFCLISDIRRIVHKLFVHHSEEDNSGLLNEYLTILSAKSKHFETSKKLYISGNRTIFLWQNTGQFQ